MPRHSTLVDELPPLPAPDDRIDAVRVRERMAHDEDAVGARSCVFLERVGRTRSRRRASRSQSSSLRDRTRRHRVVRNGQYALRVVDHAHRLSLVSVVVPTLNSATHVGCVSGEHSCTGRTNGSSSSSSTITRRTRRRSSQQSLADNVLATATGTKRAAERRRPREQRRVHPLRRQRDDARS